jgi:hypothetical protein
VSGFLISPVAVTVTGLIFVTYPLPGLAPGFFVFQLQKIKRVGD